MRTVHQLVAGFHHHDAISNEALVMRRHFREWGHASEIFSETRRINPDHREEVKDISVLRAVCGAEDVAILHLSIGSAVNDLFPELPCRKVILYHNITPPEYFRGLQEEIARHLARGREQMRKLAGVADVVLADSAFNARELEALGYGNVGVLPLMLDLSRVRVKPHGPTLRRYRDGVKNILFVGRCAPNKCIHDLIHAFYYFKTFVEPGSRLLHVGSSGGLEHYHALLLATSRDLELDDVNLLGSAEQDELAAFYQTADLFLCMSEHEGFCLPLLEAMAHDVPILAYDAAAVPDTLDGAGVLFREKDFAAVAEMMRCMIHDGPFRQAVIAGQRARLARYEARDLAGELRGHLRTVLDT